MEECVSNVVLTVVQFEEKSTTRTYKKTAIIADSEDVVKNADGDSDAAVDVIPQCLLQEQSKTSCEFNTLAQQESTECDTVDFDSDVSFCNCSADMSEVSVELVQTDAARISANSLEQSVPCHEEPHISELAAVAESESVLGGEIPYEFDIAECIHCPEMGTLQDVCTFAEESDSPEVPELVPESVEEPLEIAVCLERAELRGKTVTESAEQLPDTAKESAHEDVEEVPTAEQVESSEVPSEVIEAELREKTASETGIQVWSLESDDIDDCFEMAYDGQLSPEEIPSETVLVENRTQPVCSSSDQLAPDDFDGTTEDISSLETEDMMAPSEIPSDTVVLENKRLESSYTSDQVQTVVDEEDQVKEMVAEFEEATASPDEILSEFVVVEVTGLEMVNTVQLEAPVEEDHSTEILLEDDTSTAGWDEIQSEFVQPSGVAVFLIDSVSGEVTDVIEPDQYTDLAPVDEERVAEPEEISSSLVSTSVAAKVENLTAEVIEKSLIDDVVEEVGAVDEEKVAESEEISSCHVSTSVTDKVENRTTEMIEKSLSDDTVDDVAAVDEEKVAEPEEIGSSLVSTSVTARVETLTTELVDKSSFVDSIVDGPDVETEELPKGTVLDSPLVSDETVKVRMPSCSLEQISEIRADSLDDDVSELRAESVEVETVEDLTAEAGSVGDLPESCAAVVKEEQLQEEFGDLVDDVSPTSFVSEATSDVDADSSVVVRLPVTVVSHDELESAGDVTKIYQRTPERQLTVTEEDRCGEMEDATAAEAVVGEVRAELETAAIGPDLEVYETYVEEEVTTEEKITESILTTVTREERSSVQEEDVDVTVNGGTKCMA